MTPLFSAIVWSLLFLAAGSLFGWQMWGRLKILTFVRKNDGRNYKSSTFVVRTRNMMVYAFGQKKFFKGEQPAGAMHVMIFWGFLILSLEVITMFLRGWFPGFKIPGNEYYGFIKDIFHVVVLMGISCALYRWLVSKPERLFGILPAEARLRSQSHWEAFLILFLIAGIMVSGTLYDAGRIVAMVGDSEIANEAKWQPVSSFVAGIFGTHTEIAALISTLAWWTHNIIILIFLNLLPRSKHFHIITSIPNVFFGKVEAKGHLPKKDYTVEEPLFGTSKPDHFSVKQVLDMYSCTECGRCSSVCPAAATGKPLAPRQFLLNLRDNIYAQQSTWIAKKAKGETPEFDVVVGEGKAVSDEVVWSCVQCRACEEACPVNIEYVDKMVDIRQHLVQEASRFPAELNRAFKGMETNSNPWGISSSERGAWAEGLNAPLITEKPDAEYLYYVGCGGSFDSANRKTTQSFINILNKGGVSFAVLGKDELCNGETARRLGNEYLYQSMGEALVTLLNNYKIKKILVNCPHCFNTLKNEYPDFGGNYEVVRAGDIVKRLVAEEKLKMKEGFDKKVVYHDSCNYGRFNGIYDEPRDILKSVPGARLEEMTNSREKGTCCGAGGGRMWLEEAKDQRVNMLRADQALEKSPDVIATSCPFCKIMLGSAVNEKGANDKVQVMDVMEIVSNNLA